MEEEFDILELIVSLIEGELNIPTFYLFCEEDLVEPYCIFKINNNEDIDRFDNKFLSEYFSIEVSVWFTQTKDTLLYKKIKNKLVENGFRFKKSYDLIDESSNTVATTTRYFGKLMEFQYKKFY